MQNILVYIIIAAAVIYSIVAIVRSVRQGGGGCTGDSCSHCSCNGEDKDRCNGCK